MRSLLLAALASVLAQSLPTGATADRAGYWTITSVPPAPFVMDLPAPLPPPPTPAQQGASDRFWKYADWQGRVRGEAATVDNFLREAEKGNYVTMRFEDEDGRFRVVYSFLRDGPGTLAKYHRNPDFFGETVRWSEAELQAALEVMIAFLRSEQVRNWSGGTGASNRAEVQLPFTKAEWDALVARRKFKVPEPVQLLFEKRSASEINTPLAPPIARGIRLFARSTSAIAAVPDIASHAKIVLRNGCFRVAGGGVDGAHVLFPLGQKLFTDTGGYLAFGEQEARGYARVGELVEVHGTFAPVEESRIATPIQKACGPGKVVAITAPTSAQAERTQAIANEHAWLRRSLPESYGLSKAAAEDFIRDCAARFGGRCIMAPPPPPIGPCPTGTLRKQGMCRTPQGHIRPVPKELEPYLKL